MVKEKPYDFLYNEISRMGTHPTYYSTLFMAPKSEQKKSKAGIPNITIFIGGNHKELESYMCGTFYLFVSLFSFIEMCGIYKKQINQVEYAEKMINYARDSVNFVGKYLSRLEKDVRKQFEEYRDRLEKIIKDSQNLIKTEKNNNRK